MSKRQMILDAFGFSKKIKQRGIEIKFEIPRFAKVQQKVLQCSYCARLFVIEQVLSVV